MEINKLCAIFFVLIATPFLSFGQKDSSLKCECIRYLVNLVDSNTLCRIDSFFESESSPIISKENLKKLDEIVVLLKSNDKLRIKIYCFAWKSDPKDSKRISHLRAKEIGDFFYKKEFSNSRFEIEIQEIEKRDATKTSNYIYIVRTNSQ